MKKYCIHKKINQTINIPISKQWNNYHLNTYEETLVIGLHLYLYLLLSHLRLCIDERYEHWNQFLCIRDANSHYQTFAVVC